MLKKEGGSKITEVIRQEHTLLMLISRKII